jgi:hypothetical protein
MDMNLGPDAQGEKRNVGARIRICLLNLLHPGLGLMRIELAPA